MVVMAVKEALLFLGSMKGSICCGPSGTRGDL